MRITVRRTGGVAGIALGQSIDTDNLSTHEKQTVADLARATMQDVKASRGASYPDQFQYSITVEQDGTSPVSIHVPESAMSPAARDLVNYVRAKGART